MSIPLGMSTTPQNSVDGHNNYIPYLKFWLGRCTDKVCTFFWVTVNKFETPVHPWNLSWLNAATTTILRQPCYGKISVRNHIVNRRHEEHNNAFCPTVYHTHGHTCTHACTHARTHARTCTQAHRHTHTHTHTHLARSESHCSCSCVIWMS